MKWFGIIGIFIFNTAHAQSFSDTLIQNSANSLNRANYADSFSQGVQMGQQIRVQRELMEQQKIQNEMLRMDLENRKFEREQALRETEYAQDQGESCEDQCKFLYENKQLKKGVSIASCIRRTCN